MMRKMLSDLLEFNRLLVQTEHSIIANRDGAVGDEMWIKSLI